MTMTTIGGINVLSAEVAMPYVGIWHIDGEAGGDVQLSGAQVFEDHGVQFHGTILRSTVIGGRMKFRLVGGVGGFAKELAPAHWSRPTVGTLIRSLLSDCGERLSATVDASLLTQQLDQWKRNKTPASRALQAICDKRGLIWRVLRDGSIWVGKEEYPATATKHVLVDEDWSAGVIEIAPEEPALLPGVTFRDQRIRYVVHRISPTALRSEAYLETPGGLLDRFLAGVRQEIDYSRSYPAEVVAQNADHTLQVRPFDPKVKGEGLNKVPIRTGLPGFVCRVHPGAIVSLEFEAGDPANPRASMWNNGADVLDVEFVPDGAGSPGCRIGDEIEIALPMNLPLMTTLGPATVTVTTPVRGTIVGPGNTKFLI